MARFQFAAYPFQMVAIKSKVVELAKSDLGKDLAAHFIALNIAMAPLDTILGNYQLSNLIREGICLF